MLITNHSAVTEDQVQPTVQLVFVFRTGPQGGGRFVVGFMRFNIFEFCILEGRTSRYPPFSFGGIYKLIAATGTERYAIGNILERIPVIFGE